MATHENSERDHMADVDAYLGREVYVYDSDKAGRGSSSRARSSRSRRTTMAEPG